MTNFDRTIQLIGQKNFDNISNIHIAVIGLGGVGGTALEALVRTGFRKFTLVDFDQVDATNLNRQILYNQNSVGKNKIEEAYKHIKEINECVKVNLINAKINDTSISKIGNVDFIIDAIDDVEGKISIIKYAKQNKIPFVCSLGMANRFEPDKISVIRLDKTTGDPLAKKFRYQLKNTGIDTKDIICVFSNEEPINNGKTLSSIMMVPSSAGLAIASHILKYFCV